MTASDRFVFDQTRRAVIRVPRVVLFGLLSTMLCSCITTHRVQVPRLHAKVELQDPSESVGLDLVCSWDSWNAWTSVDLVKGTPRQQTHLN